MGKWKAAGVLVLACLILAPAEAQRRKEKEWPHGHLAPVLDIERGKQRKTQRLEAPAEPPPVQIGETSRLTFHTAPLVPDGILSKQVRSALRTLFKSTRRNRIVHLRAFVAGSGDTRRVQAAVSEVFADRNAALPSLSVVQVGKLPLPTAQVVLEAVAEAKRHVNPNGLAFISGQASASGEEVLEVAPLARRSIERIRLAAYSMNLEPKSDVLRVTCYCSSLDDGPAVRREMRSAFPRAALNYMQLRRVYTRAAVNCEAVARMKDVGAATVEFENPKQLVQSQEFSQIVRVGNGKLAFSGTQIAFQHQDSDVELAFERLGESLDGSGSSFQKVVMSRFYTLSAPISDSIRKLRFGFFDKTNPPAATMVELEGLPSLDASFAMDVIAVAGQ